MSPLDMYLICEKQGDTGPPVPNAAAGPQRYQPPQQGRPPPGTPVGYVQMATMDGKTMGHLVRDLEYSFGCLTAFSRNAL